MQQSVASIAALSICGAHPIVHLLQQLGHGGADMGRELTGCSKPS